MVKNIGRREFVKVSLIGGSLVASIPLTSCMDTDALPAATSNTAGNRNLGVFVRINPDNTTTIGAPTAEMGQGTFTSMPMIIAEELDADWARTDVALMPLSLRRVSDGDDVSDAGYEGVDYAHAYQGAGGSGSVKRNFSYLRKAGAQVRSRLVRAAANRLSVPVEELRTENSYVIHDATDQTVAYGELAEAAVALADVDSVELKHASEFRILGKYQKIKGCREIVTGAMTFGQDCELPDMLHAVLIRSPYFKGTPLSFDDVATRAVPGVLDVIRIDRQWPDDAHDGEVLLHGAVAVVAETLWAALKGRSALKVEWDRGPFADESTEMVEAECRELLDGRISSEADRRTEGDVDTALLNAERVIEADYAIKPLAHVCMEPHSAIADMRDGQRRILAAHQFPERAAHCAAKICGCDPMDVRVETARMGGGFGRKFAPDYLSEAIWLSHRLQKPVKVTWTRDDDIQQDAFNRPGMSRLRAGLDENNNVVAWDHTIAGHTTQSDNFPADVVPNFRVRYLRSNTGMWFGPWRGPGHNTIGFVIQSFIDELALATGRDPLEFRLAMLGEERALPFQGWGADVYDTGRAANVLKLAAEKGDWRGRGELPPGRGRGIASHFTFGSYCAHVVDVRVSEGELEILRVVSAIDCGQAINKLGIEAQIQGGAIDGLSAALHQAIHVRNGQVVERNFDTYRMMRIDQTPRHMETHIVDSDANPSGTGEVGLPPVIPALTNAIYAATGKRIRSLPIADQLKA